MRIILKEDVEHLGRIGATVDVKRGFARNYLIPKNLALELNNKNLKRMEHERKLIEEKAAKLLKDSHATANMLNEMTLRFVRHSGEEEKLFGSVTVKDVAEALKAKGYEIDRRKIVIEEPIKRLGTFKAAVKLPQEVTAHITIKVVKEEE
ncbi:MAG TPA: 50S ribosomal protein L9 [Thermodesulfovibrionia bacterium]|nr:50S ribosomal protein L9 [Thermodesulfovibrionia bacterium]